MLRDRKDVDHQLRKRFIQTGEVVNREEWQAMRDDRPMTVTYEIADVDLEIPVPLAIDLWQDVCQPNLPWAEDHFKERVGGVPLNPGEQYKNWPWYEQGVEEHKGTGKFSHTYMERMWGDAAATLDGVVKLLRERPMTRQAYCTIWWPIDVMNSNLSRRVPCSLGYLFQFRPETQSFDMWYYMRSVDFYRYLWDDIYMAGRLLQWVRRKAHIEAPIGSVHLKIANLHVFAAEQSRLEEEFKTEERDRLNNAFR